MYTYKIDFSKCKDYDGLYDTIYEALEVPNWCGHNLDALWDVLTGFIGWPANVTLKGINSLNKELKSEVEEMIPIFKDAKKYKVELKME